MKAFINYDDSEFPPTLKFHIHGCYHKRQPRPLLQRGREYLWEEANKQIGHKVKLPIDFPVDLWMALVDPCSPDLDHVLEAFFMMVDGKTLKGPSIFTDDRHIQWISFGKLWTTEQTKRDGLR